jgi:putative membrane protein
MKRKHQVLLIVLCAVFVWSYVGCYDRFTWFLEVLPVLVAIPILGVTYRRFPLTDLLYTFIAVHAIVLMIGGHYTYARVPPFDWIRDYFELSRNHYDKVGHFAQGFIPALITREVLLRTTALRKGKMLFFLVLCVCLAFSAVYELVEWVVAEITEAEDFLGTQGDVWDTQKDMAYCLAGAILALLLLSRKHDRELLAVPQRG